MKKSHTLHNTHLTLIDYLNEGMTTRNHRASLHERFRIMCRHYGYLSTLARHAWFALRLLLKKGPNTQFRLPDSSAGNSWVTVPSPAGTHG